MLERTTHMRLRHSSKRSTQHGIVVSPRELAFEDEGKRRTFPRARVAIETREVAGRHQAVLTSDDETIVLYDSLHEVEVDWLVKKLKETMAR